MPENELFLLFVHRLNSAGVRYVIGGSVAAIFFGEPRFTFDVDIVVFLNNEDILRLPEMFPAADFYLPPAEVIFAEVAREQRGHFNILHKNSSFKAHIYPTGRDEFNAWAFRYKRQIQFQGATLVLGPIDIQLIQKSEQAR